MTTPTEAERDEAIALLREAMNFGLGERRTRLDDKIDAFLSRFPKEPTK